MKKKDVLKRTKYTTNTYMREAVEYDIVIEKENDLFITIKKYKKLDGKFSLPIDGEMVDYIDEGHYLVELTPLKEKYNLRFYFDENKKFIDYYIDITLRNGVDHKIPYYVDLYLDIIHYPNNDTVSFCDENELEQALREGIVSKKDYEMAYKVGHKLIKEIEKKENMYLNMDILSFVDKYFK